MTTTLDQPSLRTARASSDPVNRLLARAYTINWETVAYIIIFVAAVLTRFINLGDRVMSHDESLHTRYSYNLYNEGSYQHTPLMHGPLLFHVTAFVYFLFGDNDFTARIYPAVLGILIVLSPYLFRRWLGRTGALLASVMILISPLLMYYNRYIREDTPAIFFTLMMFYAIMMYLSGPDGQRRRARWLYLLTIGTIGNLMSKETAFFYVAIFGSFLTLYFVARLVQYFWKKPGKTIMNVLAVAFLLGGTAALGMYCVVSIIRPEVAFGATAAATDRNSFIGWTAVVFVTLVLSLIGAALWAFRGSIARIRASEVAIILLVALIALGGLLFVEEKSYFKERSEDTTAQTAPITNLPIYAVWVVAAIVIAAVLISWRRGWWRRLHRFPELDIMIVLGTLILPWSAALFVYMTHASPTDYSQEGIARSLMALIPLAAISIVVGLVWNWKRWLICAVIFHLIFAFFYTTMFTNVQGLASGMVGSLGYWLEQQGVRRGNQPQYYFELVIMPFYEFLPMIGGFLAMLAGLTWFWRYRRERLEEHVSPALAYAGDAGVLTAVPTNGHNENLDSELPSMADLTGDGHDAVLEERISAARAPSRTGMLTRVSFILFAAWWAVLNLIAYTLAGEKMPWLGTHLTVPLILMTAWYFAGVFDNVDWSVFFKRGWLLLILFPLLFITLFTVAEPFLVGQSPFTGLQTQQLADLYAWLGRLAVAIVTLYLIYLVSRSTGWRHLRSMVGVAFFVFLAVLTFRSAFLFSFINYNDASEFGVYAHSAPAVKWVLNELTQLSERTTGGMDLKFVYDNETSWPNSWYFRHFPNGVFIGSNPTPQNLKDAVAVVVGEANRSKVEPILADQYYDFDYIRMWWPMQDYFNLTAARIANTFDFSPANPTAGQIRQGLFDIWWSRDYKTYSQAVGAGDNWTLTKWSISDRMHFYVRKDVAAQIWNLGTGQAIAAAAPDQVQVNQCTANWQPLAANVIFGQDGDAVLDHPLGMSAGSDGHVYVADELNNRVNIYDGSGSYLSSVGGANSTAGLNRPNGVAFGPDGNLYIADTWNYRVVVMSTSGDVLRSWGQPGQFGADAPQAPEDAFWAPRDIAVDTAGNVYVSDTGNKRIRVYSSTGTFIRDIGTGGSEIGQLDEPSGVAVSPDGRVFVADTWNHRVSVFRTDGTPVTTFPVKAWLDDLGNRPYLALDPARNLLYVTDPDAARVLVYDMNGNCMGSFGQSGDDAPDNARIKTVGGVSVDAGGNVFISDAGSNRIMGYAPFPAPASQANNGSNGSANTGADTLGGADTLNSGGGGSGAQVIVTAQIGAPTEETTPDATVEAPSVSTAETTPSPTEEAVG